MPSEFDLIARYFTRPAKTVRLGVGDDAALIRPTPGMELAVTADMLVAGRHFLADADPERLGHKTLAVNLSDIAAMGAMPRWALLSLALPEADDAWLGAFTRGFFAEADRFAVELVGGDTTRGPLNLSVTLLGEVEAGQALRRDGAQPGDDIWVSGELGGAALGLRYLRGEVALTDETAAFCLARLQAPTARVALGRALRGLAHAAIDISDGLLADLGHILARSAVGARFRAAAVPVAAGLDGASGVVRDCVLAGGDDYELCFTAPPARREEVLAAGRRAGVAVVRIGIITAGPGLEVLDEDDVPLSLTRVGYDHFAS